MDISQKQYGEMVKKASPNSKSLVDIPCAFVIGGLICIIGQALTDMYTKFGFDVTHLGSMVHRDAGVPVSPFHRSRTVRKAGKARRSGNACTRHRLCKRSSLPCGGIQIRGTGAGSRSKNFRYRRTCYPLRSSSLGNLRAYLLFHVLEVRG